MNNKPIVGYINEKEVFYNDKTTGERKSFFPRSINFYIKDEVLRKQVAQDIADGKGVSLNITMYDDPKPHPKFENTTSVGVVTLYQKSSTPF